MIASELLRILASQTIDLQTIDFQMIDLMV
jgi:hypothetical protein